MERGTVSKRGTLTQNKPQTRTGGCGGGDLRVCAFAVVGLPQPCEVRHVVHLHARDVGGAVSGIRNEAGQRVAGDVVLAGVQAWVTHYGVGAA